MAGIILNNIPFDPNNLADDERNAALGRFMTAWSEVEVVCGFLFRGFANLEADIGGAIFDRVGVREQIDILGALVELSDDPAAAALPGLLDEANNLSKARNKLVHASWGLFNGQPARFWQGLTSSHLSRISEETAKGKSERVKFIFTLSDLGDLTRRCTAVRSKLEGCLHAVKSGRGRYSEEIQSLLDRLTQLTTENRDLNNALLLEKSRQPPRQE